jgi:hypothetical protein
VELDVEEEDFSLLLVEVSLFLASVLDSEAGFEPFSPFEAPLSLRA